MTQTEENIERMEDFLTNVDREVTQLDKNLANVKSFLEFVETDDYKTDVTLQKLLSYIQYVSISELILTLDRLFEPPSDGKDPEPTNCDVCGYEIHPKVGKKIFGQRSFVWYINQLKEHSTSFDPPNKFTNDELDEQLSRIEGEETNLKVVGTYRDKWFAHRDKKYFDNPMKLWDDQPLEFEVLESTVDLAKKIVEEHFSRLRNNTVKDWNAEHLCELNDIIFIRKKMLEYGEKLRINRIG
jgi:hypothetical protein